MYVYINHAQQVESDKFVVTRNSEFDFTVDEGKGWLNPSRDTN